MFPDVPHFAGVLPPDPLAHPRERERGRESTADEKQQTVTQDNEQQEQPIEVIVVPAVSEDASDATTELVAEEADHVASDETFENLVQEVSEDQEKPHHDPVIKIETAPADFRFPTTNQSRHCFTRYVEYHRCIAVRGEEATECEKYAKYYRSLCPGEWVDRWNEQRENGTFPGPL